MSAKTIHFLGMIVMLVCLKPPEAFFSYSAAVAIIVLQHRASVYTV
jgi:hypothetical protein